MERKYDVRLLDAIKARQYEETVAGVDILVKPIPEGGEPCRTTFQDHRLSWVGAWVCGSDRGDGSGGGLY